VQGDRLQERAHFGARERVGFDGFALGADQDSRAGFGVADEDELVEAAELWVVVGRGVADPDLLDVDASIDGGVSGQPAEDVGPVIFPVAGAELLAGKGHDRRQPRGKVLFEIEDQGCLAAIGVDELSRAQKDEVSGMQLANETGDLALDANQSGALGDQEQTGAFRGAQFAQGAVMYAQIRVACGDGAPQFSPGAAGCVRVRDAYTGTGCGSRVIRLARACVDQEPQGERVYEALLQGRGWTKTLRNWIMVWASMLWAPWCCRPMKPVLARRSKGSPWTGTTSLVSTS